MTEDTPTYVPNVVEGPTHWASPQDFAARYGMEMLPPDGRSGVRCRAPRHPGQPVTTETVEAQGHQSCKNV